MPETAEPSNPELSQPLADQPLDHTEHQAPGMPFLSETAPPQPSRDLPIAPMLAPPGARRSFSPRAALSVAIILSLIAGAALGAVVMRHRIESRKILVAVNGVTITDDQLFTRLRVSAGLATVHEMVQEELQLQFARKKGLAPTDAQVQARYDKISRQPGFEEKLAASRLPVDVFKQRLRLEMIQAAVLSQGVRVSDAEVHDFYRQQTDPHNPHALFYHPDAIGLNAIATTTREQADRAMKELKNDTPFGVTATEYSIDPSKTNGGRLAPLVRGKSALSRSPALETAVFSLKSGDRLGPIPYANQWWIFECVNKAPASALPFSQVRDDCREGAMLLKGKRLNAKSVEAEFQAFERSSNLQAFQKQYQPALDNVQ